MGYKERLEEMMGQFNQLGQQEQELLRSLQALPVNGETSGKIEGIRTQIKDVFEIYYGRLYHSFEEAAKPIEEPMPEQFIEDKMPDIRVVDPISEDKMPDIGVVDPISEEPKINNDTKSDDKEKKNVWKCPNCGCEDHEPGAKFCHMCGALISGGTKEEKNMEANGQLSIDFETEGETKQDESPEVEENGQLIIPFQNEEESENNEK